MVRHAVGQSGEWMSPQLRASKRNHIVAFLSLSEPPTFNLCVLQSPPLRGAELRAP
jgi:hypothetical protein